MATPITFPELPADRVETRFAESKPPYSEAQARQEASRCLYCFDAPCVTACPTSIDVPGFIKRIAEGNVKSAARKIFEANILGATCARVCPVEVLCVGSCVFERQGVEPIAIGRLQRFATDAAQSNAWQYFWPGQDTGKKVALVGAGPASLACAHELRMQGHAAVLFEKRDLAGGLSTTGVAPYKVTAESSLVEASWIVQADEAELRTGVQVGRDVTWDELLSGYDAVFVGVGLGDDSTLGIPGEDLGGVRGGLEVIENWKTGGEPLLDGVTDAIVIGGGNTALDVLRELLKLGVPRVTLSYRRTVPEMPGYRHEWDSALKEGARQAFRTRPVRLVGQDGQVTGLEVVRTAPDPDDPRGRKLLDLPDSTEVIPAQLVVVATGQAGQAALFDGLDIELKWGLPVVDEHQQTSHDKVFAGGDIANGGKEVVNAAAEGKAAAVAIGALLSEEAC
jgi:dihydropyrimidine dehydrogenase (NAD+) subunit PreT